MKPAVRMVLLVMVVPQGFVEVSVLPVVLTLLVPRMLVLVVLVEVPVRVSLVVRRVDVLVLVLADASVVVRQLEVMAARMKMVRNAAGARASERQ
jgi:hypothetical protein